MVNSGRLLTVHLFMLPFTLYMCKTNGPLGMISGAINDWQISSSSTYPSEWDRGCHEKYARLYLPNKLGWCAKYKSSSEWLQVDLGVAARKTFLNAAICADFEVTCTWDPINEKILKRVTVVRRSCAKHCLCECLTNILSENVTYYFQ